MCVCVCVVFRVWMLMCSVDVMPFLGWTPLIYASFNGHLSMVKHLIQHNANIETKANNGVFLNVYYGNSISDLHVCSGRVCSR